MNKKRLIISSVISIVLVAILMMGSTYSVFTTGEIDESANVYKTGILDITYTLSEDNIVLTNNTPMNDSNSCRLNPYRITVTNNGNVPYMFDVILNETTASNSISSKYIGTQVGSMEPKILGETTNNVIKEDVVVMPNSSVDVDVRVWISDNIQNSEIGKSFYAKLAIDGLAIYSENTEVDNSNLIANICESVPNLDNGNLIPVYYDEKDNNWKKADSSNKDNSWYDYDNRKWANSILKDENVVLDLSNNLNNGTVVGAKWNKKDKFVTLDGNDDYIDCGLENYNFSDSLSFVTRIKFNSLNNSNGNMAIIGNLKNSGGGLFVDNNNKLGASIYIDGEYKTIITDYSIVKNNWYTIVMTYDNYKLTIYVNGINIGSIDVTGKVVLSTMPITVGISMNNDKNKEASKITVSDILIFDRSLPITEVSSDYSEKVKLTDKKDLLVYYDFSDNNDIPVDTVISDKNTDGTLAFYTWIPRFKYRVWNITRKIGGEDTYSYPAFSKGIEIKWEIGKSNTGNVKCIYNTASVEGLRNLADTCIYDEVNMISTINNNSEYQDVWYTHPAFTYGGKEKEGFWIGKFETTGTKDKPNVLPNMVSLREQTVSEQFTSSRIFQKYGLSKNVDAHMLTNLEWGAVSYLTHSKYGLCDDDGCRDVYVNNSSNYYTGRSGGTISLSDDLLLSKIYGNGEVKYSSSGYYTYKGEFIDSTGNVTSKLDITKLSSTTGNVTGVYDMSGGTNEYVMGNMVSNSNEFYPSNSGVNWNNEELLDTKYYNGYANGVTDHDQVAFNRARLGDATAEVVTSIADVYGAWKSGKDSNGVFSTFTYKDNSWLSRGGNYASSAGIFNVGRFTGNYTKDNANTYTFRVAIS